MRQYLVIYKPHDDLVRRTIEECMSRYGILVKVGTFIEDFYRATQAPLNVEVLKKDLAKVPEETLVDFLQFASAYEITDGRIDLSYPTFCSKGARELRFNAPTSK